MSFPPFILPSFHRALATAVQPVVDPCNIALYLPSHKLYLHSTSHASCNKAIYCRRSCIYCVSIWAISTHQHGVTPPPTLTFPSAIKPPALHWWDRCSAPRWSLAFGPPQNVQYVSVEYGCVWVRQRVCVHFCVLFLLKCIIVVNSLSASNLDHC